MILVTGGSGTVGRKILRRLPQDTPVRVLSRSGTGVPERPGNPFEVVRGDYDRPASIHAAMAGVETVFVVTCDPCRPWQDEILVEAAAAAGVRSLVKLSALAVEDQGAHDLVTRWQRDNEELIRTSGMEWTFLRPRAFMTNTLGWARTIREDGVVRALGGATRNACIDPRDVARAAVEVLTSPGQHGRTYALTGPEAISPAQQADAIGRALGRPVRFEELPPHEALAGLCRRYPLPVAQALLESAERQHAGAKTRVSTDLAALTGRQPTDYLTWAHDNAHAFGTTGPRTLTTAA
ncbi:SDR family oxidoreductase [Kitasatospora sp. NPDC004272]